REPRPADRLERPRRDALHLAQLAVPERCRADQLRGVRVEVLGVEVVEVATRHDDLARDAHARLAAVASLEHGAFDLTAHDRGLDEHRAVLGERQLVRGIQFGLVAHLRDAYRRSGARRLHEDQHPEATDATLEELTLPAPPGSRERDPGGHLDPG